MDTSLRSVWQGKSFSNDKFIGVIKIILVWQGQNSFIWDKTKSVWQRICHFEPFAKRRKIHTLKAQIYALNLWILRCAQYDKGIQVGMTKNLSFWAFCKKRRKIHTLKAQIYTLNLWILRFAQYDKEKIILTRQNDKIKGKIALYLVAIIKS